MKFRTIDERPAPLRKLEKQRVVSVHNVFYRPGFTDASDGWAGIGGRGINMQYIYGLLDEQERYYLASLTEMEQEKLIRSAIREAGSHNICPPAGQGEGYPSYRPSRLRDMADQTRKRFIVKTWQEQRNRQEADREAADRDTDYGRSAGREGQSVSDNHRDSPMQSSITGEKNRYKSLYRKRRPKSQVSSHRKRERNDTISSGSSGKQTSGTGWGSNSRTSSFNRGPGSPRVFQDALKRTIRLSIGAAQQRMEVMQGYQMTELQREEQRQRDQARNIMTTVGSTASKVTLKTAKTVSDTAAGALKTIAARGGPVAAAVLAILLLLILVMALVSFLPSADEEPGYSLSGQELVSYAMEWIGVTRYVYGMGRDYETDWQDYADCSAFVHGVFSHFGYEIGGDTAGMEKAGKEVETDQLKDAMPGDIVLFFDDTAEGMHSFHVGIYAGEGYMVHCSGNRDNDTIEKAGPGVMASLVSSERHSFMVRRILSDDFTAGTATAGHRKDPSAYDKGQMELIYAIVAQEDNGSYEGALAVITSAMNRTESPNWNSLGGTALEQLTAPGQYCYSLDHYWEARLNGNVPAYVKQAVVDCLKRGIRNHGFTSFRSQKGKTTGNAAVQIGGNWFFGN